MMHKISVTGSDMDPIYQWLTNKKSNGVQDASVSWNFQKFLIDESGKWVGMVDPKDSPDCDRIISWIEN
jgi:glutathione peroxidase